MMTLSLLMKWSYYMKSEATVKITDAIQGHLYKSISMIIDELKLIW